jgi:penicillin-binding protein 1A
MTKSNSYGKIFLIVSLVMLISIIGIIVGVCIGYYTTLPDVVNLESIPPSLVTRILSDNDEVIAEFSLEYRTIVSIDAIPKKLIDAIIATEDSEFFKHIGVDPQGIIRALYKDVTTGKFKQGGSTITQQLAKVLLLTPEKKLKRKIREILLAMEIEKTYSKNQILEFYCNWIFFGHNFYGVAAASKGYFDKNLKDLTLGECALLAGLVRAPNMYSPYKNINVALNRRNFVLKRMLEDKKISKPEYESTVHETLVIAPIQKRSYDEAYFVERIRKHLEKTYGFDAIYKNGIDVHTTLNLEMQRTAVQAVKDGLERIRSRHKSGKFAHKLQAALLAIESKTGHVKAYVGGENFAESKFDCVYQAQRQPGSSFKPFIFATAFSKGFKPTDKIVDAPTTYYNPETRTYWSPTNYYNRFFGAITLRKVLELSINVASIKLLEKVGVKNVIETARNMGIKSPMQPYMSLGLGSFEVNLEEMTTAFTAFANQGVGVQPLLIRYISDSRGKVLEEGRTDAFEALSPETAFLTSYILQGVTKSGTGASAAKLDAHIGGKTGTTNDYHDAWFVGFSPYITTGVWMGREEGLEPIGNRVSGAVGALPIWIQFMEVALKKYPDNDFEVPSGIRFIPICKDLGCRANGNCGKVIDEAFIVGSDKVPDCSE